ncbi:MAG: SpoVG family protein [Oscillospiraceae bacterium]
MPDLEVKINSMYPPGASGGIRAYASATMDGCLGIRGIKVVEGGRDGLFVSMPSRKTENGYKEICFPVTKEFREQLHKAVLDEYQQAVAMNQAPVQVQDSTPEQAPVTQQMGGM